MNREFENQKQAAYERGQEYGYRNEFVQPSTLGYEGELADAFLDGIEDGKSL